MYQLILVIDGNHLPRIHFQCCSYSHQTAQTIQRHLMEMLDGGNVDKHQEQADHEPDQFHAKMMSSTNAPNEKVIVAASLYKNTPQVSARRFDQNDEDADKSQLSIRLR